MSDPTPTAPSNGHAEPPPKSLAIYAHASAFELVQRAAKALSLSSLVPATYRGDVPNCMIAIGIANRLGADVLMVMQNLDVIHGRPSWRAQFMIATANACGRFNSIRYEFVGEEGLDSWGCRAVATEKETGEKLVGPTVTIALTKKEGWFGKKDSKWQTIPQLMLMYRAGSWWVRAYAPELSLGFHTADENADVYDATPDGAGTYRVDAIRAAAAALGAPATLGSPTPAAEAAAPIPAHDPVTGEEADV